MTDRTDDTTAPGDGLVACRRFWQVVEREYPGHPDEAEFWRQGHTPQQMSEGRTGIYMAWWPMWIWFCHGDYRNPETGELTDEGQRLKATRERVEWQARCARWLFKHYGDRPGHVYQGFHHFVRWMTDGEVTGEVG